MHDGLTKNEITLPQLTALLEPVLCQEYFRDNLQNKWMSRCANRKAACLPAASSSCRPMSEQWPPSMCEERQKSSHQTIKKRQDGVNTLIEHVNPNELFHLREAMSDKRVLIIVVNFSLQNELPNWKTISWVASPLFHFQAAVLLWSLMYWSRTLPAHTEVFATAPSCHIVEHS